jgi:Cof subfamily protein (haloacid dehalogenase superfamily)
MKLLVHFLVFVASCHIFQSLILGNDVQQDGSLSVNALQKISINSIASHDIKCILTDMDGTLLKDDHSISDKSITSIKRLIDNGYKFFPATGRSRKSMVIAAGKKFIELFGGNEYSIPGVYSQGLEVYGPSGEVVYRRFLEDKVILKVIKFCEQNNVSPIAYCGDRILCTKNNNKTAKILDYKEPLAEEYPKGIIHLNLDGIQVNKLLIVDDEEILIKLRPSIETLLLNEATITKAVIGMLEILPLGASKGDGVQRLLDFYSISADNTMAFGDGENDIEMLKLVKFGIAMDNAKKILKNVANFVLVKSNNEDGVAEVLDLLP